MVKINPQLLHQAAKFALEHSDEIAKAAKAAAPVVKENAQKFAEAAAPVAQKATWKVSEAAKVAGDTVAPVIQKATESPEAFAETVKAGASTAADMATRMAKGAKDAYVQARDEKNPPQEIVVDPGDITDYSKQ